VGEAVIIRMMSFSTVSQPATCTHWTFSPFTLYINKSLICIYIIVMITTMMPFLRQLHWLPVHQRITFKTAVLVHKCRHGMAPPYLSTYCEPTSSHAVGVTCALPSPVNSLFHVRGQTTKTAVLPFTGQSCGTVPADLCLLNISLPVFRKRLKMFLF